MFLMTLLGVAVVQRFKIDIAVVQQKEKNPGDSVNNEDEGD